jgi:phosphonopyruvate decarboxylase
MIRAGQFVEAARTAGFTFYAGVPCSYLTPFINYVIDAPGLRYISAANEGDAVATASGAALGGQRGVAMMQNSGLGNAVSPLTSLNYVFRLPVLLIVTWRGDPEHPDEPQHALMGAITVGLLETLQIPWELFPREPEQIAPALARAAEHMDREQRPYAFIMRKGTVAPHALMSTAPVQAPCAEPVRLPAGPLTRRLSRREALQAIVAETPRTGSVVIGTTGYTGRELFAIDDRSNQLYLVGSMGCASALGLGLSLVRPELQVVVADGDGAALMRMGNLATTGSYGGGNLVHVLLDNGVHDSTGGQATVSNNVDFAGIAHACRYALATGGDDVAAIRRLFATPARGARFLHLLIRPGAPADLPRPDLTPPQVKRRLMRHLGVR